MLSLKKNNKIVGCLLEGQQLTLTELERENGNVKLVKATKIELSLDPISSEAELVGQDIKNKMAEAGIKETHCVLSLPLNRVFTITTEVPDISGEDLESFLALEAEREFPWPINDLVWKNSAYKTKDGKNHATMIAVPLSHIQVMQKIFSAAGMQLMGINLASLAVHQLSNKNHLQLHLSENKAELAAFVNGSVAVLRSIEECILQGENEAIDIKLLARELRITLGRLPEAIQDSFSEVQVVGSEKRIQHLLPELTEAFSAMEIKLDVIKNASRIEGSVGNLSPAASAIGANFLLHNANVIEFMPPKVNKFQQIYERVSSRGALWGSVGAAAIVSILLITFLWQGIKLSSLEKELASIEKDARKAEVFQTNVRKYRPWYDETAQNLRITKQLTSAFPDDGKVWARNVEIKQGGIISCSGSAKSNSDWMDMLDTLRKTPGVSNLQVGQVRGNSPLQFTFSFSWDERNSNGI